jgi:hypothetical protein
VKDTGPEWRELAACSGREPAFRWDARNDARAMREGFELCMACPSHDECRSWVLSWDLDPCPYHLVAGLSPSQRDEQRRQLRVTTEPTYTRPWGPEWW